MILIGIGVAFVVILALILLLFGGKSKNKAETQEKTPAAAAATAAPATEKPAATPVAVADPFADIETNNAEIAWTSWDTELPSGVDGQNYLIESRQLFRSTDMIEVTDDSDPGDGYTLYRTELGEFGDWSNWSKTYVKKDENTEVESKDTTSWSGWSSWTKTYSASGIPAKTGSLNVESRQNNDALHTSTWYEYRTQTLQSSGTQYRYRTREEIKYYLKDSGWSNYGEDFIKQQDGKVVNMVTQYRYTLAEESLILPASMDNFKTEDINYAKHYADVDDDAWYGPNKAKFLQTVDELGILLPDAYMNFRPTENITIGELIRAGVMINRIYNGYTGLLCENDGDYSPYVAYAEKAGFIVKGEFPDLNAPATRQEMAYIFGNSLPDSCLKPINDVPAISDMDMSRKYYDSALELARAGIITVGEGNTFKPEDGATRAQAAVIIDKVVHPDTRTVQ